MNQGIRVLEECCIPVCGTDVGVEMHHVKSLGKPEKPLKDSIKDKPRA